MENKTFLLGRNNGYSANVNKWLAIFTGALGMINGAAQVFRYDSGWFWIASGSLIFLGGLGYCIYGFVGFSEKSRLALKVKINEKIIEIKNSLWKPPVSIDWSDVSSITFRKYAINFHLRDGEFPFRYNTNADESIAIKETIRDLADARNIEVIGG